VETDEKRRLGEMLLAHGALDEAGLAAALAEQERSGRFLGEIVVALGLASSAAVSRALAEQRRWSRDSFRTVSPEAPGASTLPIELEPTPDESVATRHTHLPPVPESRQQISLGPTRGLMHTEFLVLLLLRHRRYRQLVPVHPA
jgi:hypothetical protein